MTDASSLSDAVRFLAIPAAMIAVIALLWALPSWLRRSPFRGGAEVAEGPVWIGAAEAGPAALADPDHRGGASARW